MPFFFFALFIPVESSACVCINDGERTSRVKEYSFIFYGEVESIEYSRTDFFDQLAAYELDSLYDQKFGYEPRLRIIEVLKGDLSLAMENEYFLLKSDFSRCSARFKKGEKYLIYVCQDRPDEIRIGFCNPGVIIKDHKNYLQIRKEIKKILRQKSL